MRSGAWGNLLKLSQEAQIFLGAALTSPELAARLEGAVASGQLPSSAVRMFFNQPKKGGNIQVCSPALSCGLCSKSPSIMLLSSVLSRPKLMLSQSQSKARLPITENCTSPCPTALPCIPIRLLLEDLPPQPTQVLLCSGLCFKSSVIAPQ